MTKISQSLDLKQSQNLVMTPQLQQAIKLLQLSNIELQAVIEEEIAQNPLLEKADNNDNAAHTTEGDAEPSSPESAADLKNDSTTDSMDNNFDGAWKDEDNKTSDTIQEFAAGSGMSNIGAGGNSDFSAAQDGFENSLTRETNLRDHLLQQLHMEFSDANSITIGTLLIDRLDEAGYMRDNPDDIAAQLSIAPEKIQIILQKLKQFDPAGIFAKDLAECLKLQLEDRGQLDKPTSILLHHLDLVAQHDYTKLAQLCDVHLNVVHEMLSDLRALNPKPSAAFDHFVIQTAVPDIVMRPLPKDIGGGWRVELNTETLPRVLINNTYYKEILENAKDKQAKEYLNNQMNNANWLVRAMDQRAQTILKVASDIVEQQDGFFLYGIEYLKPLTLREVAERIEMHESTVSRVTTNKYIGTPRGIYELKFFFTSSIAGADGTNHSSESVKARIKSLIDEEGTTILSDDDLVDSLKKDGVDIARRTIAKYREAMNIPSSIQRRRIKKNK